MPTPGTRRLEVREARRGRGSDPPGDAVARNAFHLVIGQLSTTVLAIVLSAALGRSLGAADFGIYYLITAMGAFAYVLAEWGQPLVIVREAARDPLRSGELLGTALALRVALGTAVVFPVGFLALALGYGARTTSLSILLILASLPLFLAQGYGMAFRARERMARDAAVSVSSKAIALAVTLIALAWGAGVAGVILAQAIAGLAALGLADRLYRDLGAPPLRVSPGTARELVAAGAPILAMTAAASMQPYLDAIILTRLAPAEVVGWYGAAKTVLGTLVAPAAILGAAAYPRIARASAQASALGPEVRSAFRPLLWLGALAGTGTYLFASHAIGLIYGAEGFGPAATILEVFAPGLFLLFVDILLGNVIYASGGASGFAIAKVASVAVGTALDFLLIPIFQERLGNGAVGVVVAFALSELVVFAGAMLALPPGTLEPATGLDAARALGAAAATLLLFRLIPPLPPWAGIPLCVAAFAAASVAFGLVGRAELAVLRRLARPAPFASPGWDRS